MFAAPTFAQAQEHDFPALTAVGRYFGIGYTKGGYHSARDGRIDALAHRNPPSSYPSSQLFYPYHAGYRPVMPAQPLYYGNSMSSQISAGRTSATGETTGNDGEAREEPEEVQAKPAEPAPTWLKPYLNSPDEDVSPSDTLPPGRPRSNQVGSGPDGSELERSATGSPRSGVSTSTPLPSATGTPGQRPGGSLLQEESILEGDSILESGDGLLDDGLLDDGLLDDTLLFEDDGLSRRPVIVPRGYQPPVRVNRYRQAVVPNRQW